MEPIKVEVFPYCPRIRFVEIREKYQLYKLSEISSLKQVWNIVCVYKPSTCVTIAYTEEQHVYQRVPKPGIYAHWAFLRIGSNLPDQFLFFPVHLEWKATHTVTFRIQYLFSFAKVLIYPDFHNE